MATWYVDNQTGNDGNSGTGTTEAWASISHAISGITSGDTIYIKGGTDYSESVNLTIIGNRDAWITVEGYTGTPGDNGRAEIDGSGEIWAMYSSINTKAYYNLKNLVFKNCSSDGIRTNQASTIYIENCISHNAGANGFYLGSYATIHRCIAYSNSTTGIRIGNGAISSSIAYSNTSNGIDITNNAGGIHNCVSYGNGSSQIYHGSGGGVTNNTVDGFGVAGTIGLNTIEGLYAGGSYLGNNLVYNCDTGITSNQTGGNAGAGENNLIYSCTTNYAGGWYRYSSDITGTTSVYFTDEGSNDYTLTSNSPARNAGADASGTGSTGMDIGAYQSIDEGSGTRIVMAG